MRPSETLAGDEIYSKGTDLSHGCRRGLCFYGQRLFTAYFNALTWRRFDCRSTAPSPGEGMAIGKDREAHEPVVAGGVTGPGNIDEAVRYE
jgi:hypothetical protein